MNIAKKLNINDVQAEKDFFSVEKIKAVTKGKRVFVRVDYNVPLDDDYKVTDTRRVDSTIPTLKKIISWNPQRIILCSHLGRPDGLAKPEFSLKPVIPIVEKALGQKVHFIENWYRPDLPEELNKLPTGSIILLENVRFYLEEEGKGVDKNGQPAKAKSDDVKKFCQFLTSLCDLYVNDAFGCCHRAHASMVGVEVPIRAAGLLVQKELEYFDKALSQPKRPYLAILGGAKVSDKIQVIESLLDRVNEMIIAGGMCFTFLKELNGMKIGKSIYDNKGATDIKRIMDKAKQKNVKIILPIDFVCGNQFNDKSDTQVCAIGNGIPDEWQGLDIGPDSINLFNKTISNAKTIIWNGPPGVFEFEKFSNGTKNMLKSIGEATSNGSITIVGGGDSAAAVTKYDYDDKMSHVSTGGGASLELLEGKVLPGVAKLTDL